MIKTNRPARSRLLFTLLFVTLMLEAAGCATNPVTGRREFVLMSEAQEVAMGQQYAPEIAASMGIYPDDALQSYLDGIGQRMARDSERPELPWQFQVVDDPVVNAFAVPGGFIYFTRGILAHMDSEAELASVLGHEIGHVTARHSVRQMSKQQLAGIVIGVGSVLLPPELQGLGQAASQSAQLLFLKFGRDDESQSDALGLRYMTTAGYEPREMVEMFRTLGRVSAAAGAGRVPEWMSTHPDPANREAHIAAAIQEQGLGMGETARDRFLDRIDGLMYGSDPRQGFFLRDRFHHPEMKFRIDFPSGWRTANQSQAVVGVTEARDAIVQLTLAREASAEAAANALASAEGVQVLGSDRVRISTFPAVRVALLAQTQQGPIEARVVFLEHGDRVVQLMGYAPQPNFSQHRAAIDAFLASYATESDPAILAATAWRLEIVRPDRMLDQNEFLRFYPGPVDAAELARLNQLNEGDRYQKSVRYKRVVGKQFTGSGRAD